MQIFKKLFNQTKASFDDRLNELLTAMTEIALEYIEYDKDEVEYTYVHACWEEMLSFEYLYLHKGNFVERHRLNDYLVKKYDTSPEMQQKVLDIGISDMEKLSSLFKYNNREVPTHIIMSYRNRDGKFKSKFFYNNLLGETEMPEDITKKLIHQLDSED